MKPELNPGEIYVGLATDPEGKSVHHVVLLPGDEVKIKRDLYWTSEQHADDPSCAWYQSFGWGGQDDGALSWELRARAVRRVPVEERSRG